MSSPETLAPAANWLPLQGVRVVEFCQVAAGPFCGMLLADFGADVVKIESPEGDGLRQWPPLTEGFSENFASLNRNKRSVVLDLKSCEGREAARQIVLDADVVVENFRPGALARHGLGYEDLAAGQPQLIYCSISAFGQSGPRAQEGGFDLTLQAIAGVMSVTGEAGGTPVKCGVPLADFASGLYAAYSIAALLNRVKVGGKGGHIDVSMFGATLGIAALQTSELFGSGRNPGKLGSAHPRNAPYQAFRAADGHFALAAGNNRLWQAVCAVLDRPDLAADRRYATPALRARHQELLRVALEEDFVRQPLDWWLERFADAGVPCAPINSYDQALADPQVAYMGWVEEIALPGGARTRTFGTPIAISGRRPRTYRRPPALGEHTEEVLATLGRRRPRKERRA